MKSGFPAPKFFFAFVIFLAVALHVIGVRQPFLGNFAQHQTDYATVVQRWQETAIHPALPVMRFIGRGQNRIFLGDIPLNMTAAAVLSKYARLPIEFSGRGLSALFFFLSLIALWRLLSLFMDKQKVFWAMLFYSFSPLTAIYGQAFLLEMTGLCFGLFGYYFFFAWLKKDRIYKLFWSSVFFSLMLATRIYYAPALIPLGLILLQRYEAKVLVRTEFWLFGIVSLVLPVLWQLYAKKVAAGAGDESSLSDNMRVFVFADPVMREKLSSLNFYLPGIATILNKIVTPLGFALAFLAISKKSKLKRFAVVYMLSFVPLFLVAPRKFIEFDYYYIPFVPLFAALAAIGMNSILERSKHAERIAAFLIAVLCLFGFRYSIAPVLIVPAEDKNVISAGRKVQELAEKDARVIAAHGSSTSLLYYTNHDGWPFELPDDIGGVRNLEDAEGAAIQRLERFRSQGGRYFVLAKREDEAVNPAFFLYLKERYRPLYDAPDGLIYGLTQETPAKQV